MQVDWEDSRGAIAVELYDKDLTQEDDFLGRAEVKVADLVAAGDGAVVGWFPLRKSGDAAKDATLLEAPPRAGDPAPYGEVFLKASLRLLAADAPGNAANWRYEQALCKSLLEPTFRISRDKRAGYLGQYKSVTRSMKAMQDIVLWMASQVERVNALLTWTHPVKTALVAAGLAAGVLACCLIPNRLLVAALVTKMFVKGLAVKARGTDDSEVKKQDPTEIQLANLLNSLPTAPQNEEAYRCKRIVWTAQHERELNRVRINLNFAFRVRCQGRCYVLQVVNVRDDGGAAADGAASAAAPTRRRKREQWVPAYVAVVNGLVLTWPTLDAAASNKKPSLALVIAGPCVAADDVAGLPPAVAGHARLSLAAKSDKLRKIRDFHVSVKTPLVAALEAAVDAELCASTDAASPRREQRRLDREATRACLDSPPARAHAKTS